MEKFVVLLRHGEAEPHGSKPDELRELTEEGHKEMKAVARGLREIFPKAERIISSPLVRAVQTAEWVSRAFELEIETSDALRPGASFQKLVAETDAKRFILVGHEPTLTNGMLALTGVSGFFELKKAGCYGVRIIDGEGQLEWIVPPKVVRR